MEDSRVLRGGEEREKVTRLGNSDGVSLVLFLLQQQSVIGRSLLEGDDFVLLDGANEGMILIEKILQVFEGLNHQSHILVSK